MRPPVDHECRATGCKARIPLGRLMCKPHWFALPKALQNGINATWRNVRRDRAAYEENVATAVRLLEQRGVQPAAAGDLFGSQP
jgi:hypothetical protein